MELLSLISHNLISFILILTVIVFVHEFGHYFVARKCGVKIDEFAIGFGKELFGFNDKNGTRWKFCLLPFGGYVKMFGDRNPASIADGQKIKKMTQKEKKVSFYFQNVYKRMAIVLAGPIANFILAVFLFAIIFRIQGVTTVLPIVDELVKDGAAIEVGLKKGDEIIKIQDKKISNFYQIQEIIYRSADKELEILIKRGEEEILFNLTPKASISKDFFGKEIKVGMIGVQAGQYKYEKLNLTQSFLRANKETYNLSIAILDAIGDLIIGKRSVKELGGPVKIAEYSGKSVEKGFIVVLWFMAMISINLGVLNLLPLPILDGGHFFYYVIEAIKGKPLPEKIQQYGFQVGFALILTLMLFTTYNDITGLFN